MSDYYKADINNSLFSYLQDDGKKWLDNIKQSEAMQNIWNAIKTVVVSNRLALGLPHFDGSDMTASFYPWFSVHYEGVYHPQHIHEGSGLAGETPSC